MSKILLASAVMLASLFAAAGSQADAAGFKRHNTHVVHHYKARAKAKAFYKTKKRIYAVQRYRHRLVLKRQHDRRVKAYRYIHRHR